jgi:hypothetical protein
MMGLMGRYSSLDGKRVEALYRAGDIQLSAIGTLVSDSGKSIFVEERFLQNGKQKTMRVEIPYGFIIRLSALVEAGDSAGARGGKPRPATVKNS